MPVLEVHQLSASEVYRDIVRVNEGYRIDRRGKGIKEGRICLIKANGRQCFAILRGYQDNSNPEIRMDDYTRGSGKLGLKLNHPYEFEFRHLRFLGTLRWAWSATEIGYQVSARLAVLGLLAGVSGILPEIFRKLSGLIHGDSAALNTAKDYIQVTVKRGTPPSMAFFAFIFAAVFALLNSVFTDLVGRLERRHAWAGSFGFRVLARAILFAVLFLFIMKCAWAHNWLSRLMDWLATEKYPPIT
jgi:hypothetical protein